ncbi:MAG: hypothetical protein KAS32_25815 [Candidatus Peribacteraceae bacterium]|nr:hypothetical protein [Candidatus Peribacteraceae bacterium]
MKDKLNQWLFKKHLEDDEECHLIVHKHWLVGFKFLFWPSVSFFLCLLLLGSFYASPMALGIVGIWAMLSLIWLFRNFFDYYLDAWLISSEGIVDIAWHGWFHRQSTRILYSDIQGVSYEICGITSTILRYGEISVEKVSTGNTITLDHVSQPRKVEMAIMKYMEEYMHSKNLKDSKHVQEILATVLAREVQLEEFEDDEDIDE